MSRIKILIFLASIFFFYTSNANQVDSLISVIETTESDSLKAVTYYDLGVEFINSDSCMYYLSKGIDISISSNLHFPLANLYFLVGVKKHRTNDLDSAIDYYSKAELSYKKSYNIWDEKLVDSRLANTYYSFALTYLFKGEYQKVMQYARSSLDIRLKYDDQANVISCYNLLGNVLVVQDEFEKAEVYFSDGLETAMSINDSVQIINFYNNLATIYTNTKEYEKALDYFQTALRLKKNAPKEELIEMKMNIGITLKYLRRYDEARKFLTEGVAEFENTNDVRGKIIAFNLLAELYIETREWQKVLGLSNRSLKLLEELPMSDQMKFVNYNLSMAYEGLGHTKNALKYYKEYTTLKDSLFNEEKSAQINKLEAQFEFEKKEKEIGQLTEENLLKEIQIAKDRNLRFSLLSVFVFVIMIAMILFINYKRKQERSRQNIALKKMEIEQRMLRSQMNPHFIFNALNSIQSYIATNDTYQAEVFLSKFSTLIRNILEVSMHEYISFDKEIETLRLYLELEKLRFNDKFDFEIDDQLTDSTFKVPPMLIQPFVENAIIHGMKGKTDKGNIKLRFLELDDDLISCVIDDNGVGRNSEATKKDHQSLATKLIDERIHFFNHENNHQFDIKIFDKKDEAQNATGTRVELLIPII